MMVAALSMTLLGDDTDIGTAVHAYRSSSHTGPIAAAA